MDAQWNDDFHHALFAVLCPGSAAGYYADFGSLRQLAKAIEGGFVYDGIYSKYRNRIHGRPARSLSLHRFLSFIQNHDQVGNRALGDRVAEIAGFERAKIAAAIVLMSPLIPMLFQGEEWAASTPFQYFADHDDPEMARRVSEGRKKEFAAFRWDPESIPDPESRETFERSKLKWLEVAGRQHAEMLSWYRELIRLRRTTLSLNDGEPGHTHVSYSEEEMWLAIERGDMVIICNLGRSEHAISVPMGSRLVLRSREGISQRHATVMLPPDSLAVISASQK